MAIPLIAIIQALAAGGTLVPHAAGGMIVTSAGGYVSGTYLSTAAIAGLLSSGALAGAGIVTTVASAAIGSSGVFGTTVGATGITGALMSAGIISSTPIWVPVGIGGSIAVVVGSGAFYYRLRRKVNAAAANGLEAQFTETEAKIVEKIIKYFGKKKASEGDT